MNADPELPGTPEEPPRAPSLIGVGVGPGDPDLVTVAAVRALRDADVVLVPLTGADRSSGSGSGSGSGLEPGPESVPGSESASVPGGTGRAEATVLAHLDPAARERVRRVPFSMAGGEGPARQRTWQAAADAVLEAVDAGALTVAFATIGDPNIYSTFTYVARAVRQARPDVVVRTVPGITAMQGLAARAGISLCEGDETLCLVPLTAGPEVYRQALRTGGTVVAYKGGRHLSRALDLLAEHERVDTAVLGTALGCEDESVVPAAQGLPPGAPPYLTTLIAPAPRPAREGGR